MIQRLTQRGAVAGAPHSLIGPAQRPQRDCTLSVAADPWIVTAVHQRMVAMPFRVVERKPGAYVLDGASEFSIPELARRPGGMMGLQQQLGVAGALGRLGHFTQMLEP